MLAPQMHKVYTPDMLAEYVEKLCDTFRDAICVTDRKGYCVLVNKRHAELTGIPRSRIIGARVQDMVKNGLFDVVLNSRVVEMGESVSEVQRLADGRSLVLEGHPVFSNDGEVAYVVTILRDVTALTALRNEIAVQKELLETFQNMSMQDKTTAKYPLVMQSRAMQRLNGEAMAIAETDATVLLLGETGVGKDVIARHIHRDSRRANAPFIKVDCGSIPENLIETELFGYVPGSFSGASRNGKAGLVEAASTGTLFLDEIGELPMPMQSRLLRVLQDFEVMRVGATAPRRVDVRVIAATNKDLEREVDRGKFRSDLYYRLKVAVLRVPPLRDRKADIQPLARSFLAYYSGKYGKDLKFSEEALEALSRYSWPGNVRELENLVQGIVATCQHSIVDVADIKGIAVSAKGDGREKFAIPALEGRSLKSIMKELEQAVLAKGLEQYGSITELARHMQMDRSTIFRKVRAMQAAKGAGPSRKKPLLKAG